MKDKKILALMPAILIICAMLGCPMANNPSPNSPPSPSPSNIDTPFDLHPLRTAVPKGFMRGADISNCFEIERNSGVYRNFDGNVEDIMKILVDNGINYARVRLWVDPNRNPSHYAGDGNNTMAVCKEIAARAKAAGMQFLLDYHYSDWWANPATQQIPYAWKDIPTKQELLNALYQYTKETIEELIEAGAMPDTVKIGNEITDGLLSQHSGASSGGTGYSLNGWQDYSDALKIAAQAVRETAPNAKIVVHLGDGGSGTLTNVFGNFTKRTTGQAAAYTEVDYDILGLSWYPIWNEHLSIDSLYSNIRNLKQTFGKEVVICETGYMWTLENFDGFGNYAGPGNEETAANLLTNSNGFVSDSKVAFAYRADGTTRYVPSTPENQARVLRAVMDAVVSAGGMGVMWWGADWIAPVQNLRSNSEMGTIFNNYGEALPVVKILGGIQGANAAKPGAVTDLGAAATGDTLIVTWTAVNSAIASKYQLERARLTDGPWSVVSDTLTGDSYSDMGLDEETAYFYRIRAYNTNGWGNYCAPLEARTLSFEYETPAGLRVTAVTADSVTLEWNVLTSAASYKVYGVQSNAAPSDSDYTLLADIPSGTSFTHNGLTAGDTWWYKLSAIFVNHGEGPASAAVNAKAGTALDLKADINMTNAVLDADFLDSLKASSSTDRSTVMKTDSSNYQIEGIYAANDAAYLYVALDYGSKRPAMWDNDWITVWIDNTNSTAGGATTTSGNYKIAANQTLNTAATIEASISQRQDTLSMSPGGTATKNSTWTESSYLYGPPEGQTVIKYRIPLANIAGMAAGAAKDDVLMILVSHTQGWSGGSQPVVGCVIPMAAVTGASADSDTVGINMGNALSYRVK